MDHITNSLFASQDIVRHTDSTDNLMLVKYSITNMSWLFLSPALATDGPYAYLVMGAKCDSPTEMTKTVQVWDMRAMSKGSVVLEHEFFEGDTDKEICV